MAYNPDVNHPSSPEFVERMGSALTQAGLPRVPSLVFSALLVDDDGRMTAAELAGSLALSAGSISAAIRYLEHVGMARRERQRGSRRDVYVVDDDAWHGAMMRKEQVYAPMIAALTRSLTTMDADSPAGRRLLLTREFLNFVDDELTALAHRWEKRRAEIDGSA
jgi:DNA-binding transcriptional regulator GbsR (MarR family)